MPLRSLGEPIKYSSNPLAKYSRSDVAAYGDGNIPGTICHKAPYPTPLYKKSSIIATDCKSVAPTAGQ